MDRVQRAGLRLGLRRAACIPGARSSAGWIRNVAALLLIALACWYIFRANIIFRRSGTPFQPWRPTRIIAAQDIYGRTRNPMYQGFFILVLGIAVLLAVRRRC